MVSEETTIETQILTGDILPAAIGVAVNAFAIIAVIVILFSKQGVANGITFLVGWIGGLAFVVALVHTLMRTGAAMLSGNPSLDIIQSLLGILLGLLFLGMGFAQWRKRPKGGVEEPLPKWLVEADAKVTTGDVITPNRSASLAFALAALNPKAIALVLATSIVVFKSSSTFVDTLLDFTTFIVVASLAVAIPVVYRVVGGENAQVRLLQWKDWLITHRAVVMAAVLFLLGAMFLLKGLAGLRP
ncbi:MAG: GAP family protein [Anaerolineae bacterium]